MLSARRSVLIVFLGVVLLLRCYIVPLLVTCSTILWYSDCSASVPLFRRCFEVPCSGVPGSIVYLKIRTMVLKKKKQKKQLHF